jgi:hypothetical protein
MNNLLLIIGLPKDLNENARVDAENRLMMLCHKLASTKKRSPEIEQIPPNLWRIPAENGLSFLSDALALAGKERFPCRILALDSEPNWIHGVPSDEI